MIIPFHKNESLNINFMKSNFIFCIFILICGIYACKKTNDNYIAKSKNHKIAKPYFRFNNVDGALILSNASINNWLVYTDPFSGLTKDTLISYTNDEIFGFFPGSTEASYFDVGNVAYNDHKVYQGSDFSYLLEAHLDSFNFITTSTFTSSWNVQGGLIPGFTDIYLSNNFPSTFTFPIDSVISKSGGYSINLTTTGTGTIINPDSIVYMIYDRLNPSTNIFKVTSGSTNTCNFSSSDLSMFTSGNVIAIDVIGYNFRHEVKSGTLDIYFINQRKFSNQVLTIRS